VGIRLALAEVQIVLARILWEFDIEFADEKARKWDEDLKIFHLWQLETLYVRLVPVSVIR
jgi:cytochrome P450